MQKIFTWERERPWSNSLLIDWLKESSAEWTCDLWGTMSWPLVCPATEESQKHTELNEHKHSQVVEISDFFSCSQHFADDM